MGSGVAKGLAVVIKEMPEKELHLVASTLGAEPLARLQTTLQNASQEAPVVLTISTMDGEVVTVEEIAMTATIAQVKRTLAARDKETTPASRLCLLHGQQVLDNGLLLKDVAKSGGKLELLLLRKRARTITASASAEARHDFLFKVLLIGSARAGKSSILRSLADDTFKDLYINTIGVDFQAKMYLIDEQRRLKLQIWDTAGEERFRAITSSYYRGCQGIMIVFDLTDRKSFVDIPGWLSEIERYGNPGTMLLVGTKMDMVHKREISREEAEVFAASRGLPYSEVSAKDNASIEEAFAILSNAILDKLDMP